MANRSLNDSLDMHFDKVKKGFTSLKVKTSSVSLFSKIAKVCHKIKVYFFPPAQFEHTYISNSGTTVVEKKSTGIFAHLELFKLNRLKKKAKKIEKKEVKQDIDVSKVNEVLSKGKL